MTEFSEIVLTLIEQTPWFVLLSIFHIVSKIDYKHLFCKFKDIFEIKLDK